MNLDDPSVTLEQIQAAIAAGGADQSEVVDVLRQRFAARGARQGGEAPLEKSVTGVATRVEEEVLSRSFDISASPNSSHKAVGRLSNPAVLSRYAVVIKRVVLGCPADWAPSYIQGALERAPLNDVANVFKGACWAMSWLAEERGAIDPHVKGMHQALLDFAKLSGDPKAAGYVRQARASGSEKNRRRVEGANRAKAFRGDQYRARRFSRGTRADLQ